VRAAFKREPSNPAAEFLETAANRDNDAAPRR
jgi:hypothetical protein